MYEAHFSLARRPFQLKPDASFLFPSGAHAYARAMLAFTAWNRDGIAVVVGEAGVGKTVLIQGVVQRLDPNVGVIVVHQSRLTATEFLRLLLARLGVDAFTAPKAQLIVLLQRVLTRCHALGKVILLVVDEAQHLPVETLEELRFLTELHVAGEPVFNLVLVGQPSLMKTLDGPAMTQFAQRVRLRYTLTGLSEEEAAEYIRHRLHAAGARNDEIFERPTVNLIARLTRGNPRLINMLCDGALVAAFLANAPRVATAHVRRAVAELGWRSDGEAARPAGDKQPARPAQAARETPAHSRKAELLRVR